MKIQSPDETVAAVVHLAVRNGRVPSFNGPGPTKTSCYQCIHARGVPGNAHIACAKPCATMTGHPHGIERGWFMYPVLFDPTWRTAECSNYEPTDNGSTAVSHAVSQAEQ